MYHPQPQHPPRSLVEGLDPKQEQMFALLGGTTFMTFALLRRGGLGIPAFLAGLILLYRGLRNNPVMTQALSHQTPQPRTSRKTSVPHETGIHVARAITINRSAEELYQFWRNPSNLSRALKYVESVQMLGDNNARWTIKLPGGATAEYNAELFTDTPNEVISWRSLPSAELKNAWSVRFVPAPGGRGTEVHFTIEFVPPGGALGRAVANLFGEVPAQYFQQSLRELKQLMETGEKATTEGQTSGRKNEVTQ